MFGIGGHHSISEIIKMNWNVETINGLGNYLATLGLFGVILLLYNLNKSFACVKEKYKIKGYYLLVLMILVLSFSFDLLRTPLFFSFQIYYLSQVKLIPQSVFKTFTPNINNIQNIKIESL